MKICKQCKLEKDLSCFSKHRASSDGLCRECKDCCKKRTKEWYLLNREKNHARSAKWHLEHREERLRYGKIRKQKYIIDNPAKRSAHIQVTNALAAGKLKSEPCKCCGQKAHAHHCDYSRPLDVMWFCRKHHSAWHRTFIPEVLSV